MKSLKKQGGFTLLELLVVVGLMAAVAVVAVSTFDNADESASVSTDLSNIQTIDQGVRSFTSSHSGNIPEQLDHLLVAGDAYRALDPETLEILTTLPTASGIGAKVLANLVDSGMEELQTITGGAGGQNDTATETAIELGDPNAAHAEANGGKELPFTAANITHLAVFAETPTDAAGDTVACELGGVAANFPTVTLLGGTNVGAPNALNKFNDSFEAGTCNLVVAFGVGNDAAANSEGALGNNAPSSDAVKHKDTTYSRYLALFHVAADADENGNITEDEVFDTPRFVGAVNPHGEGKNALNIKKNAQ